jgi:hypothetical protein
VDGVGNARLPFIGVSEDVDDDLLKSVHHPQLFFVNLPPPTALSTKILAHYNRGLGADLARVQLARNFF